MYHNLSVDYGVQGRISGGLVPSWMHVVGGNRVVWPHATAGQYLHGDLTPLRTVAVPLDGVQRDVE